MLHSERALIAVCVGHIICPGHEGPELLFKIVSEQAEDPAGFAVETSPETHHLVFFGAAFGKAYRRLDGFRAAGIKLNALEIAGGDG